MIQIKSKPGYNIIINDLNIALRAENDQWIPVSKEAFEASADAKKLIQFLDVDLTGKLENKPVENNTSVRQEGTAFVIDKETNMPFMIDGAVVADPEKSANNANKVLPTETSTEVEAKDIEDTTDETVDEAIPNLTPVSEDISEDTTEVEPTVQEKTSEKVETEIESTVEQTSVEQTSVEQPTIEDLSKEVLIAKAQKDAQKDAPKRAGRPAKNK